METFSQMKKRHEIERNNIKWKFAFGEEQFKKMLEEWNLTDKPEDLKQIVSIGYGGYILKKDLPEMTAILDRQKEEEKQARKHKKFLKEKILYTMANYEFGYTMDDNEVLEHLDLKAEEMESEDFKTLYQKCRKDYLRRNA